MSGIIDSYQQQLSVLNRDFSNIEGELKKLENDNQSVTTAYKNAKAKYAETLDWANKSGFKDPQGKVLTFKSLQEFDDLCAKGTVWNPNGTPINTDGFWFTDAHAYNETFKTAEAAYLKLMGPTLDKLKEAEGKLNTIGASLKESIGSLKSMAELLGSGDIEGSVMLLQTTRAKGLEKQLGTRISALQDRNAMIATKNSELSELQKRVGTKGKYDNGKDFTEANNKSELDSDITKKKGEIDQLNSDSQIDMIGLQSLVNKRNESFDTLTNLLGKFQKTIDGIVGNYR